MKIPMPLHIKRTAGRSPYRPSFFAQRLLSLKHIGTVVMFAFIASILTPSSLAALNIPSDGSDGALVATTLVEIDLSQAVTGDWNANNSANAGKGIYDPKKWAIVFKYSSVQIGLNTTVRFKNHPSRAPVVWLVSGNVEVAGTLNINGQDAVAAPAVAEPGPGGFRGGFGSFGEIGGGPGFGPGGGQLDLSTFNYSAGSYGTLGQQGTSTYGNTSLLPLIGGSGGSGDKYFPTSGRSGGGGGGAILIASAGSVAIGGTISADGGQGGVTGGSGGGIRIICSDLLRIGDLSQVSILPAIVRTIGGTGRAIGGVGRIRVELVRAADAIAPVEFMPDASFVRLQDGDSPTIWPTVTAPSARIVSIGSVGSPADPRADFYALGPDVIVGPTANTPVLIETTNATPSSIVKVRVAVRDNGSYSETTATLSEVKSLDPLVIHWVANAPVNPGYSVVQARVIRQ